MRGQEVCTAGVCELKCESGTTKCEVDGQAVRVNLDNDASHCGSWDATCTAYNAIGFCSAGSCDFKCKDGSFDCDKIAGTGCEVYVVTDVRNCGVCGNVCAPPVHATAGCAMGACGIGQCDMGWGDCDMGASNGCETELLSNDAHCGACGNACALTTRCKSGVCEACPLKLFAKLDHATGPAPASLVAGDFDGDRKLDLATANFNANTVSVLRNAACLP